HRVVWPDGQVRWLYRRAWTTYDENGRPTLIHDTARDITHEKLVQEKAQQRKENLQNLFDNIDNFLFVLDMAGNILEVNSTVTQRLAYKKEALIGQSVLSVHPPDRWEEASQIIQEMLQGKRTTCPIPLQTKSGSLIPVETHINIGRWNNQEAIFGISKDISELKESEEKFAAVFQANPAIAGLSSLETGEYVEVNDAFYEKMGFLPEEVIGHQGAEIIRMDDAFRDKTIAKLQEQGFVRDEECVIYTKDGKPLPVLLTAQVLKIQDKAYNFTIATDISDLKKAEKALFESENRLRSVMDNMEDMVWVLDLAAQQIIYLNPAVKKIYGLPAEAFYQDNETWLKHLHPDDVELAIALEQTVLAHGSRDVEYRIIRADGQVRWLHDRSWLVKDEQGNPIRIEGLASDITEQKEAKEALQASEAKYRSLVESSDAAIAMVDENGRYLYLNSQAALRFEKDAESLIGENIVDICPLGQGDQALAGIQKVIRQNEGIIEEPEVTFNGKTSWFRTSIQPVLDAAGQPYAALLYTTDITARKMAERELITQNAIIHQSNDMIALADLEGKITFINAAGAKLLGSEGPANIIGANLHTAIQTFAPEAAERLINESIPYALAHGVWNGENRFYTQAGQFVDVAQTIFPIFDDNQQVIQIATIVSDISEQKAFETTLKFQASLLDQVSDAILATDFNRNNAITYWNKGAEQIYGWTKQEAVGQNPQNLLQTKSGRETEEQILKILAETGKWQGDLLDHAKDGTPKNMQVSARTLKNDKGEIIGLLSANRDVTQQRQAEIALQQSEAYLRSLVKSQTTFNIRVDAAGYITYCNDRYLEKFGWVGPSIVGTHSLTLILPEDHPKVQAVVMECLTNGGAPVQVEIRKHAPDDAFIWTLWEFTAINNELGELAEIQCVGFDITTQKQAEKELQAAHDLLEKRVIERTAELESAMQRLEAIYNHSGDGILLLDTNGAIQQTNYAFDEMFRQPANTLLGTRFAQLLHVEDAPLLEQIISQSANEHQKSQLVAHAVRPDGTSFDIEISIAPVNRHQNKVSNLVCIVRDITERKAAEAAVLQKQAEEHEMQGYLKMLHQISIRLASTQDLDDFFRLAVAEGLAHFGFERLGLRLYDADQQSSQGTYGTSPGGELVDEHHIHLKADQLTTVMRQTLEQNQRFTFLENTPLFADNKPIGTGQRAIATLWNNGVLGWLGIDNAIHHRPLTKAQLDILGLYALTIGTLLARKQAELALQESEARYVSVVQSQSELICRYLPDLTLTFVNKAYCRYFNTTAEALIGRSFLDLIPEADRSRVKAFYEELVRTKGASNYEHKVISPDGVERWQLWTDTAIVDENGTVTAIQAVGLDITERKQAEEALQHALEQEKELGELKSRFVSMASHEFRTPLATILATTETLSIYRDRMDDDQIDTRLQKIRFQVSHMKDIMEDVLNLARIQAARVQFNPETADLNALCQEIIEEFGSHTENRDRIEYACEKSPLTAVFDTHLMRQIISNIISNALKYSATDKQVLVTLKQESGQVLLSVQDHGIGIPAKDFKFLFEPFHRATNVGTISGTGLGLSIAKQAVQLHGGTIVPESQVGEGTTITVTLPETRQVHSP
ncbi:MAG: PAS domain S-box protein, partial [Anaerolineales bacterium]|nr:PAS domain S-box protein [Anaerolineales bacterium]